MNFKNIIGDKDTFAIEYEVTSSLKPFIYGKFCYWINKVQIGAYDEGVTLSDILGLFSSIVRENGNRCNEELFQLESKELFDRISKALRYENEYAEQAQIEQWRKFEIGMCIDIFYDYTIYMVEVQNKARIILSTSQEELSDIYIKKGVFDNVSMQFYMEFNKIYDILINN